MNGLKVLDCSGGSMNPIRRNKEFYSQLYLRFVEVSFQKKSQKAFATTMRHYLKKIWSLKRDFFLKNHEAKILHWTPPGGKGEPLPTRRVGKTYVRGFRQIQLVCWQPGTCAGPKFVRPHRSWSWVMERFLEIQGPNCREILQRPPPKQSNTCLL